MSQNNVKNPASIDGQISKLIDRGLIIEDMDFARETLTNINYYRLVYYFALYLEDKHHYREGTTFNNVLRIYDFDRRLRALLLSSLEEIEISLRALISNYHSMKYGALGYINPSTFNRDHKHQQFMAKIDRMIEANSDKDFVNHHEKKYGGAFPLWVIMDLFSFGTLSYFYIDMQPADKKEISQTYFGVSASVLENWIYCLSELRNTCAHYNRLYGTGFKEVPRTPPGWQQPLSNTLFDYVLVIKLLHRRYDSYTNFFVPALENLFNEYDDVVDLLEIGFGNKWKTRLLEGIETVE